MRIPVAQIVMAAVLMSSLGKAVTPAAAETAAQRSPVAAMAMSLALDAVWAVGDSTGGDDLGPSTAPPWNPPEPVRGTETWESVLRVPTSIVLLPVTLAEQVLKNGLLVVEKTAVIPRLFYVIGLQERYGLYASAPTLGDRTGFGLSLLVDPPIAGGWIAAEFSGSTRKYNRTRVRAGRPYGYAEYQLDWRPSEQFYGIGPNTRVEDQSAYAARVEKLYASVGNAWAPTGRRAPRTELSGWIGPRDVVVSRGRDRTTPSFTSTFPGLALQLEDQRVSHTVYGFRASHDRRTGAPHWSHGWRVGVSLERFDKPIGDFALRDPNTAARSFRRITYDAEIGFSFFRDPRTVRFAIHAVDLDLSEGTGLIQLTDLSRLGGPHLQGFDPGRFQDLDMMVGKISYIFPMSKHLEFDIHTEWGGVYRDLSEDPTWRTLERSWGVALRPRIATAPLGAIGLDWSRETVRLRFSLGGVE